MFFTEKVQAAVIKPSLPQQNNSYFYTVTPQESIQSVIDKAYNAGGGTVQLEAGTYTIYSPIILKSNVTLIGKGSNNTTIIKDAGADFGVDMLAGADMIFAGTGVHDVIIKNLKVDGNIPQEKRQVQLGGIYILDSSGSNNNILIEGVDITQTCMGLHIKGTSNVTVSNCNFYDNSGGTPSLGYHNAYLRRVSKANITHSSFRDSITGSGLNVSFSDNITVQSSNITNNKVCGIRLAATSNADVLDNSISNCTSTGILLIDENNSGVTKFRINNNNVKNNKNYGIWTFGSCDTGEISNNVMSGNTPSEYYLFSTNTKVTK